MPRKFNIELQNPCSEDWNRMKPVENGRFCDSCAKKVVDFTAMNEKEIAAYFTNHQNICGRMYAKQLEPVYVKPVQWNLPFHKRAARYLFSLFMLSGILKEKAAAQTDSSSIVQRDSSFALPGDSVTTTEKTVTDSNITSTQDSLHVEIDIASLTIPVTDTIYLVDAIVCGGLGIAPPEQPIPGVTEFGDSVKQVIASPGINLPSPAPAKEGEKPANPTWAAILPDRLRRKRPTRKQNS